MMSDFIASMYQITRAGKHVSDGLFNSAEELFDCIRCQRAGVYSVYRQPPQGQGSGRQAEFWGDVAHFGAGKISFDPCPAAN
jgi:hypothetical protein